MSDVEWFLDEVIVVLPDGTLTTFGAFVEWLVAERPKRVVIR